MTASARHIRQLLSWLGDRDRQLQLALDAAELGTWNWDPTTNELAWSDRCRTLIGVSADEPPRVDTFLRLVHPDDRAAVEKAIESTLQNGDSYSIEYRLVMPDGEIRWLHSLGRVHQTGMQPKSFGMSGIIRDVTLARRASEAALRHQQYEAQLRRQDAQHRIDQRYRLLVETLPLGIMLSDREGIVTYLNMAWQALASSEHEQAVGLAQAEVIHPQDRARVRAAWQRLGQEASADLEFRLQARKADECWVHCLSTVLRDVNGVMLGYAHACIDVSSRRRERDATEQRHLQVLGLAHRLQRLRLAERLDLAGLLQREILNELTALPDTRLTLANTIERLRRIVYELNPPGIEELGFAGALERFLTDQAERSGFEFELTMPEAPTLAPPRSLAVMYGVAQEAIENISRHARATRVQLAVHLKGGNLQLEVRDNGVGISERAWPRPKCYGLLAASERLAELGGTLRTSGVPGQGTIVEAEIPLSPPPGRLHIEERH
jgi:PAS domain S-box-containing protein